jgi:hypothetical protein
LTIERRTELAEEFVRTNAAADVGFSASDAFWAYTSGGPTKYWFGTAVNTSTVADAVRSGVNVVAGVARVGWKVALVGVAVVGGVVLWAAYRRISGR